MITLIVCLAVVALSGAVVLLVVREEPQPATPPPGPQVQSPSPEEEAAPEEEEAAAEETAAARQPRASIRRVAPPRHPVRSAVLLVFLLATVGALLALAIAVAVGLLVMAMRAGVG
ncbi:MAG TPA: hypothetical protein VGV63_02790 [Acidimicrobiales bacterium]|nr:hypothetical protein [Acidimicrobiales bacterium]